jgi:hypothetical protein
MASTSNTAVVEDVVENVVVPEAPKKAKKTKAQPKEVVVVDEPVLSEMDTLKALVDTLVKRIDVLETSVEQFKTASGGASTSTSSKPKKEEKEKKPRAPTAYNNYMKAKMLELKESHPDMTNITRMKMAAEAWSESKK